MNRFKSYWQLMRLEHGFMIAIAIFIGSIIGLKGSLPPFDKILFTFCTALFLEASTFALNDYYDIDIDKENNRVDRPLIRGDIKPRTALMIFYVLFPLGIMFSFFVNFYCFIIALITGLFAIVYDVKLKKIKLIGNFYIAYTMSVPFIFGGISVLKNFSFELNPVIVILAFVAFLAGSGREIMKDVMDFEGDKKTGVKSFPRYFGLKGSNIIAALFFIGAIVFSFFPYFISIYELYYLNYYYLFPVFLTDTMLLNVSIQLIFKKKPRLNMLRKFTLVALFFGLIAFLIPVFFRWTAV